MRANKYNSLVFPSLLLSDVNISFPSKQALVLLLHNKDIKLKNHAIVAPNALLGAPGAFQAVAKGCHYIFLPSFITSSCLTIDNINSTTMCPPQFCEWLNSKYGFHTIQGNRVECSLHHGMNQPVQNVRPTPTITTILSPNKYKLET